MACVYILRSEKLKRFYTRDDNGIDAEAPVSISEFGVTLCRGYSAPFVENRTQANTALIFLMKGLALWNFHILLFL
jgi:hypothetical protein